MTADFEYDETGDLVRLDEPRLIGLAMQDVMIAPLSFELLHVSIENDPMSRHWPAGHPGRSGEKLIIKLNARVLHRDTAEPVTIQFGKAIEKQSIETSAEYLPAMVRQALLEMMAHEIDEVLMQGGKRLREPHR